MKTLRLIMALTRQRRRAQPREPMDDAAAAETIQAWFNGNISREKQEENRIRNNIDNGMNGASQFRESSRLRRKSTVKMPKVCEQSLTVLTHSMFRR